MKYEEKTNMQFELQNVVNVEWILLSCTLPIRALSLAKLRVFLKLDGGL